MKIKLRKVDKHLKEKLRDPYFRELYELEEQKILLVKKIIDYRIQNNLTQEQLAEQVGVTQQHISKIENGEFSSMRTLLKVLLYIGFKVAIKPVPLGPNERKKVKRTIQKLQIA